MLGIRLSDNPTYRKMMESLKEEERARESIATHEPTPPVEEYHHREADPDDSLFMVMSANDTLRNAQRQSDPVSLYDTLWYEGEICCLFADSNVGKSILAMQIATYIARNRTVLYFDFELSDKQFQLRYTDSNGNLHTFPNNLYRVSKNSYARELLDHPLEEIIMRRIEQTALEMEADVLIIDNLTYLCLESEKGEIAGRLMMKLMEFKKLSNLSVLVLAHTPKRSMDRPITQNDLAGSKRLINFFDSAFAIGKSAKDESLRYVKQVKVRNGEFTYNSDNVKVCEIVKEGSMLCFKESDNPSSSEYEHLRERTDVDAEELRKEIRQLQSAESLSIREIARRMGLSKSKVSRLILSGDR